MATGPQQSDGGAGKAGKCGAHSGAGNGRKMKLSIGINVVAALQRNEKIGLSWRGIWEDG